MKYIILIATLLISQANFAQTFSVDKEFYDCDFAGQSTQYASKLKQSGITFDNFKMITEKMPVSENSEYYLYYSALGFQSNQPSKAYDIGYRMCMFNRS